MMCRNVHRKAEVFDKTLTGCEKNEWLPELEPDARGSSGLDNGP